MHPLRADSIGGDGHDDDTHADARAFDGLARRTAPHGDVPLCFHSLGYSGFDLQREAEIRPAI